MLKKKCLQTPAFNKVKHKALLYLGESVHAQPLPTGKDELHWPLSSKCGHSQADNGLAPSLLSPRDCRHLPSGSFRPLQGAVEQQNSFLDVEHEGFLDN